MASIQKTAKGYRAQVQVGSVRESSTFPTQREAVSWGARRETEIRAGAGEPEGSRHTLRDAFRKYAETESPDKRGERWELLRLKAFENPPHKFPLDKKIGTIGTDDIAVWRDARLQNVMAASVLREINLLSSVFESARKEWRWIKTNPVRDLKKPVGSAHRDTTITRAQIKRMLRALDANGNHSVMRTVACCLRLALRTGMRAGEICNLKWSDVHAGYCSLRMTKNGKARDVPLTAKAVRIVESMRGYDKALVFGMKTQTLDAMFRKYRTKAGLSGFTFHDSRHTAATWIAGRMVSKGIPAQQAVFDLCKMFGWTRVDQALVYYNPSAADIAKRIT